MTIPKPSVTAPSLEAWGFIVSHFGHDGFDRHEKYWFNTHSEMICFLCLGASEYLNSSNERPGAFDEWKERCKALDEKFLPTVEASRHGKDHIVRAMSDIANTFDSDESLAWWGQFRELVSGSQPFAQKLREEYYKDSQLVNTPTKVTDTNHFNDWLVEFDGFIKPRF
jgi:hypothetical protein